MRCFGLFFLIVLAIGALIMFDVAGARDWVMDGLGAMQQGVETLSEWGDEIMGRAEKAEAVMEQAGEAVDATRATIEKISE